MLSRQIAAETIRLYSSDWNAFAAWCRTAHVAPLPAEPRTIADYLATLAKLSPGAAARRLAAIGHHHRQVGLATPTTAPGVRTALRQSRRTALPRRKPLPTPAQLLRIAAACPRDLAGLRDRALLLILAETAIGRSALTSLQAEHVQPTPSGFDLVFGDLDGAVTHRLPADRGSDPATCPVRALEEWLCVSDTSFGPVFRKIDRWGNVELHRLNPDAIRLILIRRSAAIPRHGARQRR